jgi:hypothetical protein
MKFCKSLQRMMDISDPEWVPYYTNYKMLKKLVKELHPTATEMKSRMEDEYDDAVVTDNTNTAKINPITSLKVTVETRNTINRDENVFEELSGCR